MIITMKVPDYIHDVGDLLIRYSSVMHNLDPLIELSTSSFVCRSIGRDAAELSIIARQNQ